MREQIKFGLIRTQEEFDELKEFAKSFDHHLGDDSIAPIYTASRGRQLIGYFNLLVHPIIYPAVHPEHCTHRNFYEALQYLKNHFCMNSISVQFPNGTCFMALPLKPALTREMLEECGFKATGKELWQAIPP